MWNAQIGWNPACPVWFEKSYKWSQKLLCDNFCVWVLLFVANSGRVRPAELWFYPTLSVRFVILSCDDVITQWVWRPCLQSLEKYSWGCKACPNVNIYVELRGSISNFVILVRAWGEKSISRFGDFGGIPIIGTPRNFWWPGLFVTLSSRQNRRMCAIDFKIAIVDWRHKRTKV